MKKMKYRKLLAAALVALCLGMAFPVSGVMAVEVSAEETCEAASSGSEDDGVMPCADEIGYIYRIYKGRVQRRLWNYTQGEWYSKKWEDVGPA